MDKLTYDWKMKGLTKVSPDVAVEELKRLQSLHGSITPELLVTEAEKSSSPLHNIFEWDNDKAAYNYRLQQARTLLNNIQVTVLSDGEPKTLSVFEVTSSKGGYKSIDTFEKSDIDYVKMTIRRDLIYLQTKLHTYTEFKKVLEHVNGAIAELN